MTLKRAAGAPIEFVSPRAGARARAGADRPHRRRELLRRGRPRRLDAHRRRTCARCCARRGVELREHAPVHAHRRGRRRLSRAARRSGTVAGRRLLIASGAWTRRSRRCSASRCRSRCASTRSASPSPGRDACTAGIGHATGLLTLKQKANGSFLIGGGWQGRGSPASGRGRGRRATRCCRTCGSPATPCPPSRALRVAAQLDRIRGVRRPTTIRWPARCRGARRVRARLRARRLHDRTVHRAARRRSHPRARARAAAVRSRALRRARLRATSTSLAPHA